mgnify:CR=1 FL=1
MTPTSSRRAGPLSWGDVLQLVLYGEADYRYVLPLLSNTHIVNMYLKYVSSEDGCSAVTKFYGPMLFYDMPLKDNCTLLRQVLFGTEKSWYPTLALVNKLADRVSVEGNYSFWSLVYWENGSIVVEFYDLNSRGDAEGLDARLRALTGVHPVFVVLTLGERT